MITKEKFVSAQYVVAAILLLYLANVQGCSKNPETTTCPDHMCNDNKNCYTQDQLCDGNKDCEDNTDEDTGHCDLNGMPTFENVSCKVATTESKWDLCIKVNYPNDNGTDYMLLEDGYGILTYKGEMKMEKISVVFSWPDSEEGEDNAMAQFHSMHVGRCVDFRIELTGEGATGRSTCIENDPTVNGTSIYGADYNDMVMEKGYEPNYAQRNTLNRNGYEMNLDVYFDDDMVDVYRSVATTKSKLRKIMAYVQEIYEEKDTLQTSIKMNINIEHKRGERWALTMARFSRNRDRTIWNTMGTIASRSGNKHLYAFITSSKGSVMGGWANINALCGPTTRAVSISRYYQRNAIFTSRLIAHELGHNFGMHHDFIGSNTRNVRRDRNGRPCYGYMDYRQDTNYWSTCNVEYLTRQNKNCLKELGGGGGGDNNPDKPADCKDNPDYPYCGQFTWACSDARYPWFRNTCKKTCRVC